MADSAACRHYGRYSGSSTMVMRYQEEVTGQAVAQAAYRPAAHLSAVPELKRRQTLARLRLGCSWVADDVGRTQRLTRDQRPCQRGFPAVGRARVAGLPALRPFEGRVHPLFPRGPDPSWALRPPRHCSCGALCALRRPSLIAEPSQKVLTCVPRRVVRRTCPGGALHCCINNIIIITITLHRWPLRDLDRGW